MSTNDKTYSTIKNIFIEREKKHNNKMILWICGDCGHETGSSKDAAYHFDRDYKYFIPIFSVDENKKKSMVISYLTDESDIIAMLDELKKA